MAHASALGRCTHHLAGQQTMPSAGDVFVCAPRADIAWAGGSRVACHHWRRHLGGSLPLFSGVNALKALPAPHHPPSPLQYFPIVILPVHTASLPSSIL